MGGDVLNWSKGWLEVDFTKPGQATITNSITLWSGLESHEKTDFIIDCRTNCDSFSC